MKNFYLFILILLTGCAMNKVNYRMPASRFNTPEVTGGSLFALDLKGRANANYGSSNRVSSSSVIGELIGADSAEVIIEDSSQLGLRLDLSLFDRMDIYWNYTFDSPTTGGLKWQFLGKTEEQFVSGWKSSIAAGLGSSSTGKKLLPVQDVSTTTFVVGSIDTDVYDFNWHIGYRFPERLLLYFNIDYTLYKNDLSYKQGTTTVEQSTNFNSNNFGAILGLQYYFKSKISFLLLELGWSEGEVKNYSSTNSIFTAGLDFGWRFD